MKQLKSIIICIVCGLAIAGCDEGDIQDTDYVSTSNNNVVHFTANVKGIGQWSSDYVVALAAFGDEDDYSLTQVSLPTMAGDGQVALDLQVNPSVTEVQLCVVDNLRRHIATLATQAVSGKETTMAMGDINVGMFSTIQTAIFDASCARCHGQSGKAAAGMFLTSGKSYDAIVNHASARVAGGTLIIPGDPENSVLRQVVRGTALSNHADILNNQPDLLNILDNWIKDGAKE